MSPRIYKAYTSYIKQKLAWSIQHRMSLSPTTGKLIAKCRKACETNLLSGKPAIEGLLKRRRQCWTKTNQMESELLSSLELFYWAMLGSEQWSGAQKEKLKLIPSSPGGPSPPGKG
jgi:hypothetical protein